MQEADFSKGSKAVFSGDIPQNQPQDTLLLGDLETMARTAAEVMDRGNQDHQTFVRGLAFLVAEAKEAEVNEVEIDGIARIPREIRVMIALAVQNILLESSTLGMHLRTEWLMTLPLSLREPEDSSKTIQDVTQGPIRSAPRPIVAKVPKLPSPAQRIMPFGEQEMQVIARAPLPRDTPLSPTQRPKTAKPSSPVPTLLSPKSSSAERAVARAKSMSVTAKSSAPEGRAVSPKQSSRSVASRSSGEASPVASATSSPQAPSVTASDDPPKRRGTVPVRRQGFFQRLQRDIKKKQDTVGQSEQSNSL